MPGSIRQATVASSRARSARSRTRSTRSWGWRSLMPSPRDRRPMSIFAWIVLGVSALPFASAALAETATPVTAHNFVRAETDLYFRKAALDDGAFGKLRHRRTMASIDRQDVVRMNRDT